MSAGCFSRENTGKFCRDKNGERYKRKEEVRK